jgi:uncharacterized Zn finger protein (UPF0148 family)
MSDWDTERFLKANKKRKLDPSLTSSTLVAQPAPSTPPSTPEPQEECRSCHAVTTFVECRKQGAVICPECGIFVEPLIEEEDWQTTKARMKLEERIRNGEYYSIFKDATGTIIANNEQGPYSKRERLSKLARTQRDVEGPNKDTRLNQGYKWIQHLCFRHSLATEVRVKAGLLWQQRIEYDRKEKRRRNGVPENAAVFVYHTAMQLQCPVNFIDLAFAIMCLPANHSYTKEEQLGLVMQKARRLKKLYAIHRRELGIPSLSAEAEATAWIIKKMPMIRKVSRSQIEFALQNLRLYLNHPDKHPAIPAFSLAASVIYLTFNKDMGVKCTLEEVEKCFCFFIKTTTISRNNQRIRAQLYKE